MIYFIRNLKKAMHVFSRWFRFGQREDVLGCKHSHVPGSIEFPTEGRTFEGSVICLYFPVLPVVQMSDGAADRIV